MFSLPTSTSTPPSQAAIIAVPGGGPESLEIDAMGGRAYTNGSTSTIAIDLTTRAVSSQWSNGCTTSKGLAIDSAQGWVMALCQEGMVVVLAAEGGATIGTATVGGGVDQASYDSLRKRLYVPGPVQASMSVVSLGSDGKPTVLGSIETTNDAHCAVSAGLGSVYVCSPSTGALLFVRDPF